MALEKYLPDQQKPKNLLQKIFGRNLEKIKPRKRIDVEFFNADKTKRFAFREIQSAPGVTYELDVSLAYASESGFVRKMQVMTRVEDNIQYYGIELDVISEANNKLKIYYYNRETGGQKSFSGLGGNLTPEETEFRIKKMGIIREAYLPEFIDYERTALAFLQQAKNLDFETEPVLYPKELILSESPKALPSTP